MLESDKLHKAGKFWFIWLSIGCGDFSWLSFGLDLKGTFKSAAFKSENVTSPINQSKEDLGEKRHASSSFADAIRILFH